MSEIINLKDIEYSDKINKKLVFDNEQSSLTLLSFKAGVERSLHCDEKDEVAQRDWQILQSVIKFTD